MTALGGLPALPRRGRSRVSAAALLATLSLLALVPTSDAAFSATSTRSGTFASDSLDPPGSFTATRSCASPTFRSASVAGNANGTSASVSKPAGLVADDVMIAWAVTGGTSPITAEAGWTQLQELQSGNATMRASVFWKRAGSSEPASYTFSWASNGLVTVSAYKGVSTATAIDASGINGVNSKVTSITTPQVTTTVANARLVHSIWVQNVSSISYSSALTVRSNTFVPAGAMAIFDEARPTTGTTTARTFSYSTSQYATSSAVALRPASTNTSSVSLSWTATPDTYATGYDISVNGGTPTSIAGRTTTSATHSNPSDSTAYTYDLRSVASTWRSAAATASVAAC